MSIQTLSTSGRFDETVTYNANGSITSLQRNGMKNNGTFGAIDNLTISYNGNQLVKVTDDAEALNYSDALDFNDGADMECEYDYDSNGALTRDGNRGVKSITYDYGHHPSYINMNMTSGPRNITNDYTPDGRKLLSKHVISIPKVNGYTKKTITDKYIDGLILRGDTTLLWRFDGGYVELNANGTPTRWNYYITDHLGSTRMVVDSNDSIRETINYYPFGSEMRMEAPAQMTGGTSHPFRFTGKELDRQNNLNMYDFGARMFDVAGVPMWTSIDPLAEKYYSISPYAYCNNNPVILVDPDGKKIVIWYGPKGSEKSFVFSGSHGKKSIKIPNNSFVKAVIQAYNYDCQNGGGKPFKEAVHRKEKIYVADARIYNNGENDFDNSGRQPTVYWNPDNGIKTTEGGSQSPATILNHEIDHANDYVTCPKDHNERADAGITSPGSGYDSQFDTKEERRVITGSEARTALSNGEAIRNDHKGTPYRTISPTSTKPY